VHKELDINGDGVIGYDEFEQFMSVGTIQSFTEPQVKDAFRVGTHTSQQLQLPTGSCFDAS
jgi:hypothetical protein